MERPILWTSIEPPRRFSARLYGRRRLLSCSPKPVVPYWTASTDAFWKQTLAELKASGKTVLIGARIPTPAPTPGPVYDFSAELSALHGTPLSRSTRLPETEERSRDISTALSSAAYRRKYLSSGFRFQWRCGIRSGRTQHGCGLTDRA